MFDLIRQTNVLTLPYLSAVLQMDVVARPAFYYLIGIDGISEVRREAEYFGAIDLIHMTGKQRLIPFDAVALGFMPGRQLHKRYIREVVTVDVDETDLHLSLDLRVFYS